MYKRLSILEVVYYDNGLQLDSAIEGTIIKQLSALYNQFYCVSIVVRGELVDAGRLLVFVKRIKEIAVPISVTCIDCCDFLFLNEIVEYVIQIRIGLNKKTDEVAIQNIYYKLKTPKNNIIFLIEPPDKETASSYCNTLESNDYIFNVTYNHKICHKDYWEVAKYISALKESFPHKIFYEFTCAGILYQNIEGICPARTILMCIDVNGKIKYCYKDDSCHGMTVFDDDLCQLFAKLSNETPECQPRLCDKNQYRHCMSGCPLDISESINKYCKYNS